MVVCVCPPKHFSIIPKYHVCVRWGDEITDLVFPSTYTFGSSESLEEKKGVVLVVFMCAYISFSELSFMNEGRKNFISHFIASIYVTTTFDNKSVCTTKKPY